MALQSGSLGDVRGPDYTRMAVRRMWRDARRRKDGAGMLKALDEAEARGSTVSGSVTEDQDTAMRNAAAQAGRRSQMIEAMVVKSMRDRLQAGKKGLGTSTASKTVPEAPSSSAVSPDSTTTEYKPEGSTKTTALLGDEEKKPKPAGAEGSVGDTAMAGTQGAPDPTKAPLWNYSKSTAEKPKGVEGAPGPTGATGGTPQETTKSTGPSRRNQSPYWGSPAWQKRQEGEWFNADTGKVEKGTPPSGYREVGISGSGVSRRTSYAKDSAESAATREADSKRLNDAYAQYQARKRDVAEAARTPGGMDMVRRNRAREAAAKAADARATEEQVTKDLYGQADINEATMRRMNPDEPVRQPSVQSRTRREKQIRDELNKRKQRAAMIRRFGA